MSRPRLFIFLAMFCAGLAAGEVWRIPMVVLAAVAATAAALLTTGRTRLLSIAVLSLVLGFIQMGRVLKISTNDVSRYLNQTVIVTGDVVLPSTIDGTAQRFEITDGRIGTQLVVGKLIVSVPAIPTIPAASRVRITCTITELTPTSKLRQWSHGIHARCATLSVTIIDRHLTSWRARLGQWQESLLRYVRQHYNEPQASLLNGILIGNTDGMPDRLNQAFLATGTTHIVALSGFNVTIIMALVVGWLVRVVGRRWAWLPALVLLIAFVVMSGASASVVRAAIMAVIVQTGLFIGRPVSIGRLLAYTSLAMAWVNPLVVFHDLGFQLSFLATVGLVALVKPLANRLNWVTDKLGLRDSLATTLAAIIMTEPLLLWRFGRISLVAPVVNVLVVPLIPLAMAIGSVSLVGMLIPLLAGLFIPAADALLRLIVFLITYGASWPNALVHLTPAITVLCGLGFVILTVVLLTHHENETHPA